jgi:hypothetical protein
MWRVSGAASQHRDHMAEDPGKLTGVKASRPAANGLV